MLPNDVGALVTEGLAAEIASPASEIASPAPEVASAVRRQEVQAPERCANCSGALRGAFCHACGQRGDVHRSVWHLVEEILHGVFHFEGRAWRTLPLLFFRPGQLTRRYVYGERVRFVSPLALFLFSVFVMFVAFSVLPHSVSMAPGHGETPAAVSLQPAAGERQEIESGLAARRTEGRQGVEPQERLRKASDGRPDVAPGDVSLAALTSDPLYRKLVAGHPAFDRVLAGELRNPALLLYKLKSSAYKFSWTLVLISLPFMWLLFCLRRDVRLYDHAIFVLYSLSFISIFVVLMGMLGAAPHSGWFVLIAIVMGLPLHAFSQLKGAYALTTAGALWRTAAMLAFAPVCLLLFAALIVAIDL